MTALVFVSGIAVFFFGLTNGRFWGVTESGGSLSSEEKLGLIVAGVVLMVIGLAMIWL